MRKQRSKSRADWWVFLRKLQTKLEEANKSFSGEVNGVDRSLLNQLFVVAGGFITLASALLVTKDILRVLAISRHAKYVLLLIIGLSLASIFCGIAQLYIDARFLRRRKAVNAGIIKRISENRVKDRVQLNRLLAQQDTAHERSGNWWMFSQFILLICAGLGIGSLAYWLLFMIKITG